MEKQMHYQLADGSRVPLFEAEYDMSFTIYKSDKRKSTIGDPLNCIEAKGICRLPNVIEAYIGAGALAVLVFGKTASRPFKHAVHFVIPAKARKVVDAFDTRGAPKTQELKLKVPSKGRTLAYQRRIQRDRHAAIRNGAPVKKRSKPNVTRMQRLGVKHRPRAKIVKDTVSLGAVPA